MNRFRTLVGASLCSIVLLACNQTADQSGSVTDSVSNTAEVQDVVLDDTEVNDAYVHYLSLKNALVASDSQNAQAAALNLSTSLGKIEGCDHTASIAKKISASSDLAQQRENFTPLSSDLIALMKNRDVQKGTLYVQYCPMANSGKGGFWLASSKEIRNPYYGDEMLNCGEVKETITAK